MTTLTTSIQPPPPNRVTQLHPGVATAVVLAREDTPIGRALVAYVRPKIAFRSLDDIPPAVSPSSLSGYVSQTLPRYMVPRYYMHVNSLPYTPSGKIDRQCLLPVTSEIAYRCTASPEHTHRSVDNFSQTFRSEPPCHTSESGRRTRRSAIGSDWLSMCTGVAKRARGVVRRLVKRKGMRTGLSSQAATSLWTTASRPSALW